MIVRLLLIPKAPRMANTTDAAFQTEFGKSGLMLYSISIPPIK